jgi:hypothetical protein
MAHPTGENDDLARLKTVQKRVRQLAWMNPSFAEAIRKASPDYAKLDRRHTRELEAMRKRIESLCRELLSKGYLIDPAIEGNAPCFFEPIIGLCPVKLAATLSQYGIGQPPPVEVQREGAKAALAWLDRDAVYQSRDLADSERERMAAEYRATIKSGTHVEHTWHIVIARPYDWREPANLCSLRREDMDRFSDSEYKTIVLYLLGGLADIGALRSIIPQPEETGDMVQDLPPYLLWRGRFLGDDPDELSPSRFPPEAAEEMLAFAKARFIREDQNGDESSNWRDAVWFKDATEEGIYADLLRRARKDGRIQGQLVNGRWRYSPEKVAELWPAYREKIECYAGRNRTEADQTG